MNLRDKAEAQAKEAVAMVCEEALKTDRIVRDAVAWFDQSRPQWGPGALPTWYVDARAYLRADDQK